jgi:ubiquitin thioesterase protein OTUB1
MSESESKAASSTDGKATGTVESKAAAPGLSPEEAAQQRALHEAHQSAIEAEILAQAPTGSRENCAVLLNEYKDNAAFHPKINQLCTKYGGVRRSRGDGNCFYRSVAFQLLDQLRDKPSEVIEAARGQHRDVFEGLVGALGYERFTAEDFFEAFAEAIMEMPSTSAAGLEAMFGDDHGSMYYIYWIRLLTSFSVQAHPEKFAPFIMAMNFPDLASFCKAQVEPAKVDADQLPIQALAEHMKISIRIEYLDGRSEEPLNHHDFGPAVGSGQATIYLLYRPGHYDMLVDPL